MLFYIALFIACVIIAVAFLYLFRALENVGKDIIYQVPVQSIRTRQTNRPKEKKLVTTVNDTPMPWGWNSAEKPDNTARVRPAAPNDKTPWGWQGNHKGIVGSSNNRHDSASNQAKIVSPSVGWPYREEKFELGGKSYKVTRRVTLKPTDLSKASKPWGW